MRPSLTNIDTAVFDIGIIGAGINGAAAAQAAAASGYRVAMVDKGDYGSGSSSRSSRLLHCGLRYLTPGGPITTFLWHPGRFLDSLKTIRRSMAVRSELVRSAPSYLSPVRMHYPICRDGPYAPWMLDAAFGMLHMLSDSQVPLDYRRTAASKIRTEVPFAEFLANPQNISSIASYTEYQFDWPERLILDMVLSAEHTGAYVRNYTQVTRLQRANGLWEISLADSLDGTPAVILAKNILNLSGPWVDRVNETTGVPATRKITGTKGAHLVFKLPESCRGHGFAAMSSLNRPFYCMPWRDLHFFGPTETLYEGDADDAVASSEDVDFILAEAQLLFPKLGLTRQAIVSTWAGVRPLTHDPKFPMGHRSRRIYDLGKEGLPHMYALSNGSLGAHRQTARDLLGILAQQSGSDKTNPNWPPTERPNTSISMPNASHEHVVRLDDYLARRTGDMWSRGHGLGHIKATATRVADELGWDDTRTQDEITRYTEIVQHHYGIR